MLVDVLQIIDLIGLENLVDFFGTQASAMSSGGGMMGQGTGPIQKM